jgi:hypothetical protein
LHNGCQGPISPNQAKGIKAQLSNVMPTPGFIPAGSPQINFIYFTSFHADCYLSLAWGNYAISVRALPLNPRPSQQKIPHSVSTVQGTSMLPFSLHSPCSFNAGTLPGMQWAAPAFILSSLLTKRSPSISIPSLKAAYAAQWIAAPQGSPKTEGALPSDLAAPQGDDAVLPGKGGRDVLSPTDPGYRWDLWTVEGRRASASEYRRTKAFKEKRAAKRQQQRAVMGPLRREDAAQDLQASFLLSKSSSSSTSYTGSLKKGDRSSVLELWDPVSRQKALSNLIAVPYKLSFLLTQQPCCPADPCSPISYADRGPTFFIDSEGRRYAMRSYLHRTFNPPWMGRLLIQLSRLVDACNLKKPQKLHPRGKFRQVVLGMGHGTGENCNVSQLPYPLHQSPYIKSKLPYRCSFHQNNFSAVSDLLSSPEMQDIL